MRLISLSTFIIGCSLFEQVLSQNCPETPALGEKCRRCTNSATDRENYNYKWITDCQLQVSITCTVQTERGTESCFVGGQIGNDEPNVRFEVKQEECEGVNPPTYEATIVYKSCNLNSEVLIPTTGGQEPNYIRFANRKNIDAETNVEPNDWDTNMVASDCKTHTITRTFEPCKDNNRGMSIALDGRLQNVAQPNYCRCFLREYSRSQILPRPATPAPVTPAPVTPAPVTPKPVTPAPVTPAPVTPAPVTPKPVTPAPVTPAPVTPKPVTPAPVTPAPVTPAPVTPKPVTPAPVTPAPITPAPVTPKPVTLAPTPAPAPACDFSNVIITELASPEEYNAKYIEIYFNDQRCRGLQITEMLKIVSYKNQGANYYPLQYKKVGDDGFLTICNHEDAEDFYGEGTCGVIGGMTSPANLVGTETVNIVKGNSGNEIIIDTIGNPYFVNGRVVRRKNEIKPLPTFKPNAWYVFPGECRQEVGPEAMDINEWKDVQGPICPEDLNLFITEIVDLDVGDSTTEPPRYVELYTPKQGDRDDVIDLNLKLVIFSSDNKEPHWNSAVVIDYVPGDGFILVCNHAAKAMYGNKCTITSGYGAGPANSNGNDQIALISGDEDNGWFVVDIYGIIGEDGYDTARDFADSRVIRKLSASSTKAKWSKDDWVLCAKDTPDPKLWQSETCGGAPSGPTDPPTSAPTTIKQGDCEFFFTEISDEFESAPFVEIYSTCPGVSISRPIVVLSKKEYGFNCEVELEGMVVPEDGFIIICENKISHMNQFGNKCDIESELLLGGHGTNTYAIKSSSPGCDDATRCEGDKCTYGCSDYLDIYGYLHSGLEGTSHEYTDCRVLRKMSYAYGSSTFKPNFWENMCPSIPKIPEETSDPRIWKEAPLVLILSELTDPIDASKRFIEFYSPNKRNYKITDQTLRVLHYKDSAGNPDSLSLSLVDMEIDENGFLVVCSHNSYDECNEVDQTAFIRSYQADSRFTISSCTGQSCVASDTFGRLRNVNIANDHDFTRRRTYRLPPYSPTQFFIRQNWVFTDADKADPGRFPSPAPPTMPPAIQPVVQPVVQPSSKPKPRGPSKGKGKKHLRRY